MYNVNIRVICFHTGKQVFSVTMANMCSFMISMDKLCGYHMSFVIVSIVKCMIDVPVCVN